MGERSGRRHPDLGKTEGGVGVVEGVVVWAARDASWVMKEEEGLLGGGLASFACLEEGKKASS